MVTDHTVRYLAGCTQFNVCHPVDDVVPKLKVQPPVVWIAQVPYKIFELDAPGLCAVPPVFPNDARGNLVPVPRLKAGIVNKLIFKCRNQSFEGISYNKKLEVCFQAKEKNEEQQAFRLRPAGGNQGEVGRGQSACWNGSGQGSQNAAFREE